MSKRTSHTSSPKRTLRSVESQPKSLTTKDEVAERAKLIENLKYKCVSPELAASKRLDALKQLVGLSQEEASDTLANIRDTLPFCRGEVLANNLKFLAQIVGQSWVLAHERTVIAVLFYHRGYIEFCYPCFQTLVLDQSLKTDYRVEACKYLFASGEEENRSISQEVLLDIIETLEYSSEYRYNIISNFSAKTGLKTMLGQKIPIEYDEEFVSGLQYPFLYNQLNWPHLRLLSAQHLLEMLCITPEQRREISDVVADMARGEFSDQVLKSVAEPRNFALEISKQNTRSIEDDAEVSEGEDESSSDNEAGDTSDGVTEAAKKLEERLVKIRASAADILLRLGAENYASTARQIISELGAVALSSKSTNIFSRIKLIYTDAMNVHDDVLSESINKFVEKMIEDIKKYKVQNYDEVQAEITMMVQEQETEHDRRLCCFKSLNRIGQDTACFTKYKITLPEILCHVWARVKACPSEDLAKVYKTNLIEELVDMEDWCSSGHCGRLINVLGEVKISWTQQIKANVVGRMNAKMRDIEDEELAGKVTMGMLEEAEEEDRVAYADFIRASRPDIRTEMEDEFVKGKYLSATDFERIFNECFDECFPV